MAEPRMHKPAGNKHLRVTHTHRAFFGSHSRKERSISFLFARTQNREHAAAAAASLRRFGRAAALDFRGGP